jgi:hypothetical protein
MTSASFRSSNCRSQGAVGDRRAAIRRANSAGGTYPKLLCGRSSLYFFRHAPIFARASHKFPNQLAFKHSSRRVAGDEGGEIFGCPRFRVFEPGS